LADPGSVRSSREAGASQSRRALLYATAILLALVLVMSVAAHLISVRPAALVGLPVIIIAGTSLVLILLYLVGPETQSTGGQSIDVIVEAAFVPAVAVDTHSGRILAANASAGEILGPARLTVGSHFTELLSKGSPEECRRIWRSALESGVTEVDGCPVRTHSKGPQIMRMTARLHEAGDTRFVIVGFQSNEVNEAVAEFARVQERLMSNISHELRTPLNVVMGFSELLTTGTLGELADNQLDAAQECHEGGQRMLRLINDILDVGRSRSYYLTGEVTPLPPVEMIRRMENLLSGQARREELQMDVTFEEGLPDVETDERAFKQIIYHLILNSMDRSEQGGIVHVNACREDDDLVITISDSGPEVTADIRPRPTPPASDDALDALAPPLMGLPLCATLAERIGVSLSISADADGTHFSIRMPLAGAS
jgi:signal transduction histidine kinase